MEPVNTGGSAGGEKQRGEPTTGAEPSVGGAGNNDANQGRLLHSRYRAVNNRICDERDDISKADSQKFESVINEVESLHQLVQKPREQVADAEALLNLATALAASTQAHKNEGVTPSDFVGCLLRDFGIHGGASNSANSGEGGNSIAWKDIGIAVSHVLRRAPGCPTMLGPMDIQPKQRKTVVRKKRERPTEEARPEELDDTESDEKKDTDKNMAVMFDILRKNRKTRLENLVLNKKSFAQTVENIFALSFLVKDGRAEISVNEKGWHLVSPRNAPAANSVASGEVSNSQFVFRFDDRDWKLMLDYVGEEEELMPHRNEEIPINPQTSEVPEQTERAGSATPTRILSSNREVVLQEQNVVEDSIESDNAVAEADAIRKGKRKLIG